MSTLVMGGLVLAAGVVALVAFGRWTLNREAERTAASTFEADYIPVAAAIAPAEQATDEALAKVKADKVAADFERLVLLEEIDLLLEEAQAEVKAWSA